MSTGTYAPDPDLHVVDANGLPVSGGLVWTYVAGTLTPIATYTDVALTVPNSNPIVAGSDGRFVAFLSPGSAYKFVYETAPTPPATHGAVLATRDNLTAIPIASPSTDVPGTAGELLTQGQCVYLSVGLSGKTAGQWYLAHAQGNYASTYPSTVGFVVNTALAGTQVLVRLAGQIAIPGLTLIPGTNYYISQTVGAITSTAPPTYQRIVGQALDVSTLSVGASGPIPVNGVWLAQPFSAGLFFSGSGMTWTVAPGNVTFNSYMVLGRSLFWNVRIDGSTLGGTPSLEIYLTLPGGNSCPGLAYAGANRVATLIDGNGTIRDGFVGLWTATYIRVMPTNGVNYTLGTNFAVYFSIALPI